MIMQAKKILSHLNQTDNSLEDYNRILTARLDYFTKLASRATGFWLQFYLSQIHSIRQQMSNPLFREMNNSKEAGND
jgi:hypothetical protein